MLPGDKLLAAAGDLDRWVAWTDQDVNAQMPHLTLSNLAIGQLVRALLQASHASGIRIVDMGSGTGSTAAATMLGYLDAAKKGVVSPIDFHCIEPCPSMQAQLKSEFLPAVASALQNRGNAGAWSLDHYTTKVPNNLTLHSDSLLQALARISQLPTQADLVIATANYVWHRLPTSMKAQIIDQIAAAPNAIIVVADLVQNASRINRHYFNLSTNGLCNCGNIGLRELLENKGFVVTELDPRMAPRTMHGPLLNRIARGTTNDSIFLIASRGEEAQDLLLSLR